MRVRSAVRLAVVISAVLLALPLGQGGTTEAQSSQALLSPPLPQGVVYKTVPGAELGIPCCIFPDYIQQNQLGDCYMSSLATLAMTTPGTIQNAIHDNKNGTYTVTLYQPTDPNNPESSPLIRRTFTVDGSVPTYSLWDRITSAPSNLATSALSWASSAISSLMSSDNPKGSASPASQGSGSAAGEDSSNSPSWWQQLLAATNRPGADVASYAEPVNKVLWPVLLEKAYAGIIPEGYAGMTTGGGGYAAMRAITGASGHQWIINPTTTSNVIKAITVKDAPEMSDRAGHSVLGGIFGGRGLTAIEPDLQVCLTVAPRGRTCTPICQPGHDCTIGFGHAVNVGTGNVPVKVEVLDVPEPGVVNKLAEFEEKNASACSDKSPCQAQPLDAKGDVISTAQTMTVIFTSGTADLIFKPDVVTSLADLDQVLTRLRGRPITLGTVQPCPSGARCVDESNSKTFAPEGHGTCLNNQPCLDVRHQYYLMSYTRNATSLANGVVQVGNPWGVGNEDGKPVSLPLQTFMSSFVSVSTNYVTPTPVHK